MCERANFLLYPQIEHEIYKVELELQVSDELKSILEGVYFEADVVNRKFTRFSLFIRYFSLVISLISGVLYLIFYTRIPKELVTFEHKYIALLSVVIFLFNDPLYYEVVYNANNFYAFFSVFSVILYVTLLLVFWLVMIQRIHKEKVTLGTKLLNKRVSLIGLIGFLLLVITGTIKSIVYRFDPNFHIDTDYPVY
jgi:hypothetical protein